MYRMLIVDDESDERKVIRYLLNKFNFDLYIEEASNGREALAKLENTPVDILFTDVKMPFMGGIELASKVRELHPNVQIIFFSGHDDFEYIRKALSLRAADYILKPINPQELKKTITSVFERAEILKIEHLQQKTNEVYQKNHILYRLINQTPFENLERECTTISLRFLNDYSHLFLLQFDESFFDYLSGDKLALTFYENIRELIGIPCDFINLNPSQSVFLLQGNKEDFGHYPEIATRIHDHILSNHKRNCYISISNYIESPKDISSIYEETEGYLEKRFFFPDTYVYAQKSSIVDNLADSGADDYLLKAIQKDIQLKDSYSLKQDIKMLFNTYKNKQCVSHIYIRFLFSNLLQILGKELLELEEFEFNNKIVAIYSTQNLGEIEQIIGDVLEKGIKKLETDNQSPKHAIHLVKQYINDYYGEDLSLNLLADKVFLTPRYLSSIFIQETGYGINKYIKSIRMAKAKQLLLETNMKINEICTNVGYSNVSYFCKSFQEDFGATPEKYRQLHP